MQLLIRGQGVSQGHDTSRQKISKIQLGESLGAQGEAEQRREVPGRDGAPAPERMERGETRGGLRVTLRPSHKPERGHDRGGHDDQRAGSHQHIRETHNHSPADASQTHGRAQAPPVLDRPNQERPAAATRTSRRRRPDAQDWHCLITL